MAGTDRFTAHYGELLDGTYDCVDRIILNGYFRLGCSPSGLQSMAALLVITDKVIRPVLAGVQRRRPSCPTMPEDPVDLHHWNLQNEMRNLLNTMGIAA